ncbi:MAG: hypothetical protein GY860_12410 [Desulfobacteraceae bacterium]|nr:hypothetical protein [Desulfobacteraceae bacterium]
MSSANKSRQIVYGITLFFITLTGFGQMPIFKRYYIADIPGLGWLAKFYITHAMHYIFATILIALCVYAVLDFALNKKSFSRVTASGFTKAVILLGLIVSGGLMVVRNLPGIYFPHTLICVMDLGHIGLCMALLMTSAYTLVKKKAWVK